MGQRHVDCSEESDGGSSEGSHIVWGGIETDRGMVFVKQGVLVTMQPVFNAPVLSVEREDIGGGTVQAGDEISGLAGLSARFPVFPDAQDGADSL